MTMAVDTETLMEENLQLRAELQDLLQQAHINQSIIERHQAFDLKLIGASEFRELIDAMLSTMPGVFNLETVTLSLIDDDYAIQRILRDLQIGVNEFPNLLFLKQPLVLPDDAEGALSPEKPRLGEYEAALHQPLFPGYQPVSVALLPLVRQHRLLGYLALGSAHLERFTRALATDFIQRLATVVAICLENVINNERLKHIGLTDPLTGVNNRRYIEQRMHEEVARGQRERSALSCLFIDIDHFKRVNDQYGHQSGDDVLREVAARIKKELRLSDALGRFGGEEFVVLLTHATREDAARIAERIRSGIASRGIMIDGSRDALKITASIGASSLMPPERSRPAEEVKQAMLKAADQALYQAKESGRNRVVLANN
ncbi:sensor domain-containing diguanylate cyclase [Herbaspirillum sp. WKF16]|jgi:diguanylate cyclase (GGDEF)-like protein|uniref:GGDEF domain-containing protein n=1 Tax=Herbaspirillum sp. WKF16 TaxID=3028312 RepID=UPI0023A9AEDF|nr:sensor domain-containing diguanylate cyclase [Herbaspirillum sp. WKF16]WDZ95512.1 sensor domain-containing diguanylate cyclase [Herbaspirillum sp. WKF16]